MPFTPTTAWLRSQLSQGESRLCDFKREWHDLSSKVGKGEFIKDVLAMANSATADEPGVLIFGAAETPTGAKVAPLGDLPTEETVSQILAEYTSPPVTVQLYPVEIDGVSVTVLVVPASDARPHWVTRDVGKIVRDTFFVRNGTVVGIATAPEIEAMIRQKDARLGSPRTFSDPIRAGFISHPTTSNCLVAARVTNVTTEPIADVRATLDVRMPAFPGSFNRIPKLMGATLAAGESREITLDLSQAGLRVAGQPVNVRLNLDYARMDLTLVVQYRDRSGFIQEIRCSMITNG